MNIDEKISLAEVLNLFFANKTDGIHTILPGQIISYDGHATRKAEVKPMVKLRNVHNQIIEIDPIKNVPVLFPSTKNFNFLFPLNKNDGCLLLFAESSIGNFLLNATNNAVDADDLNRFDFSDCICIPGLWSFKNLPTPPDNDTDFWLQFQEASIQIKDSTNEIILETALGKIEIKNDGSVIFDDGSEAFVLGTSFETAFTTLLNLIKTHVHDVVGVQAGGSTITSAVSAGLAGATNPVTGNLSTKIKGK